MADVDLPISTLTVDRVQGGDSDITSPSTEVMSAYLPIIFEVSASNVVVNPVVSCEVQYGSGFTSLVTLKKEAIEVSGSDLYRFDVSKALQTIFDAERPDQQTYSAIITGGTSVANQFRCKFAMLYTNELGQTVQQSEITSSTYWAANAIVQADHALQDLKDRIADSVGDNKFLTDIPNNSTIYTGEEVQLTFLVADDSTNFAMYYEEYNLAGIAQGTSTTAAATMDNRYGILPINAAAVLSNHSNMSKVDVWVQNTDSAVRVTEKKTFLISQENCVDARINWLNSWGGIDQYSFTGYKRVVKSAKRTDMQKPLTVSYTRDSRGVKTIGSEAMERWTLSTGVLDESFMEWLDDMLVSTDATIHRSTGYHEPIVIRNDVTTTFDTFEMQTFVIEFDLARKRITRIG